MPDENETLPFPASLEARFEVLEVLGSGGFGAVFQVRDRNLENVVALKLLHPAAHQGPARARFLREARLACSVRSPHVVGVRDFLQTPEGIDGIVYDFVPGGTLAEEIEICGRLQVRRVLELAIGFARGLVALHEAGILHRDLKPANLLVSEDGVPKLTDLGLARADHDDEALTGTGVVPGTPIYLAPELWGKSPSSEASDLWALGASLYKALFGIHPYQGGTFAAIHLFLESGQEVPFPRPLEDPAFEGILRRVLLRDPSQRTSSAQAFLRSLEALAEEDPTLTQEIRWYTTVPGMPPLPEAESEPGAPQKGPAIPSQVRRLLLLGWALVLACLGLFLFQESSAPPPRQASPPPVAPLPSPFETSLRKFEAAEATWNRALEGLGPGSSRPPFLLHPAFIAQGLDFWKDAENAEAYRRFLESFESLFEAARRIELSDPGSPPNPWVLEPEIWQRFLRGAHRLDALITSVGVEIDFGAAAGIVPSGFREHFSPPVLRFAPRWESVRRPFEEARARLARRVRSSAGFPPIQAQSLLAIWEVSSRTRSCILPWSENPGLFPGARSKPHSLLDDFFRAYLFLVLAPHCDLSTQIPCPQKKTARDAILDFLESPPPWLDPMLRLGMLARLARLTVLESRACKAPAKGDALRRIAALLERTSHPLEGWARQAKIQALATIQENYIHYQEFPASALPDLIPLRDLSWPQAKTEPSFPEALYERELARIPWTDQNLLGVLDLRTTVPSQYSFPLEDP